jgi:hypothetical protein
MDAILPVGDDFHGAGRNVAGIGPEVPADGKKTPA